MHNANELLHIAQLGMPRTHLHSLRVVAALILSTHAAVAQGTPLEALEDLLTGRYEWEGAIGLVLGYGPAYIGSDDYGFGVKPALYLRYGRFSLSTGAGFATRRADQVLNGLGVDLVSSERVRVKLSARLNRGRSDSNNAALAGMGEVDGTVRARLTATWQLNDVWRLGAEASIDALGRGQGAVGELSFAREVALTPDTTWRWGGSLSLGNSTYMQSYYGVTQTQSSSSGYAQYAPSSGLRDLALSTGWVSELTPDWVGFVNVGVSQALGPVLDSPLTFKALGYSGNVGLAWRF